MPIVKNREERLRKINSRLNRWGGHPATTEELAQLCGVSQSAIKQDIAYLKEFCEAPIEYIRKPKGYKYTHHFDLDTSITLTDKDIAALKNAVATLNQFRDLAVFADFRGAVEKIEQAVRFRISQPATSQAYIAFEAVPPGRGNELLDVLLVACMNRQVIQFSYQKYDDPVARLRTVYPHMMKEHRNRWYIIGHELDPPQLRVFGLDRVGIDTLKTTTIPVDPPPFDAEAYFRPALGVAVLDAPAEEVILSFTHKQGLHFRAQPFYPFRQEDILVDTEEEFRVRLTIIVNKELVFELARLGNSVQVMAPDTLINKLTIFFNRALRQYTDSSTLNE